MKIARYLDRPVRDALKKKMAFVGGPRQVGKTTFALGLLGEDADETHPAYLNWDHPSVPPRLRRAQLPAGQPVLLLDEVHKYARWRNLLKGIYDTEKPRRRWLQILENLYVCFRVPPYGPPKVRAVKKERKLYLWDWSGVPDRGPRFENLVASQLLKYCHWVEDTEGYSMELRYLRDTDRRELDFVVLRDRKPLFGVECKSGEKSIAPAIPYFAARTPIPRFYSGAPGRGAFLDRQDDRPSLSPLLRGARASLTTKPGARLSELRATG